MSIHKSVQTVAVEAALNMGNQGIYAAPRNGTPLAELVSKLEVFEGGEISTSDDYEATKEGIADFVADRMFATMDFTRNVVRAVVDDIQKKVAEQIKDISYDPFAGMEIEQASYPSVLEDEKFISSVNFYNSGIRHDPKEWPTLTTRTDAEILALMETANSDWNNQVKEWAKKLPADHLQVIWQTVFQDKLSPKTVSTKSLASLLTDYNDGNFSALGIFLIAQSLKNNVTDDFGMSLEASQVWCGQICALAASAIVLGVQRYNTIVSTGSLITGIDQYQRKVTVNKALYKEYLKDGGKVDVLFGLMVTGGKYRTLNEVKAHEDELLKAWGFYASTRETETLATFVSTIRTIMMGVFNQEITKPVGDVETEMLTSSKNRETAIKMFAQILQDTAYSRFSENWIDVLWRAVVKSRFFYNTTAYEIIDIVDYEVSKGADPKDASTTAFEAVVARFVAEMVQPAR